MNLAHTLALSLYRSISINIYISLFLSQSLSVLSSLSLFISAAQSLTLPLCLRHLLPVQKQNFRTCCAPNKIVQVPTGRRISKNVQRLCEMFVRGCTCTILAECWGRASENVHAKKLRNFPGDQAVWPKKMSQLYLSLSCSLFHSGELPRPWKRQCS